MLSLRVLRGDTRLVSALKVERLSHSSCEGYIAFITQSKQPKKLGEIPIAYEFPNVFPREVLGLMLVKEIDLTIELISGATPISMALHWMTLAKLKELKVQLQDLIDKTFIHPECFSVGRAFPFHEEERWHF